MHHIIVLDPYQLSPSHNVLLLSIANAKITKTKTTTLSTIVILNTTGILKMSISLSFLVKMDFVCRREAMLQPCICPYLSSYTRIPFLLFIFVIIIEPLFIIICFSYSHVNDFTCLLLPFM